MSTPRASLPSGLFRVTDANYKQYLAEIVDTVLLVIKYRAKHGDECTTTNAVMSTLNRLQSVVRDDAYCTTDALAEAVYSLCGGGARPRKDAPGVYWSVRATGLTMSVFFPLTSDVVCANDVDSCFSGSRSLVVACSNSSEERRKNMEHRELLLRGK